MMKYSLLLVIFVTFSCATQELSSQARIIKVPFYKQEENQCGPSALATVMNYWCLMVDKGCVSMDDISKEIFSPHAKGVLGIDLEIYATKNGFKTEQFSGNVDIIKESIDQGIPLIIMVTYGFLFYQINHFLVVTGYDEKGIIVNDGRHENALVTYDELERIWKRARYWTLKIIPQD